MIKRFTKAQVRRMINKRYANETARLETVHTLRRRNIDYLLTRGVVVPLNATPIYRHTGIVS